MSQTYGSSLPPPSQLRIGHSGANDTSPPLSPAPTHAELAEAELLLMMSGSPTPSEQANDLDDLDQEGLGETDNMFMNSALPTGDVAHSDDRPFGGSSSTPAAEPQANAMVAARRLATQSKLHPYQRNLVEHLVKAQPLFRDIMIFIQLCATENCIENIINTAAPFTVPVAMMDHMKSICVAVLLSAKLPALKQGNQACDNVLAILKMEAPQYFPQNFEKDPHVMKIINVAIGEELTQSRSRIKKIVRESIASSDSIFDLTTAVVANMQSKVTVPLCSRLAVLRKVYTEGKDAKYWDRVDACLMLIRKVAGMDAVKINRALSKILDADQARYGNCSTYTINAIDKNGYEAGVASTIGQI